MPVIPPSLLDQEERQMYNIGAERMLLASMCKAPDHTHRICEIVTPDDFMIKEHSMIFRVMRNHAEQCSRHGWPLTYRPDAMAWGAKHLGPSYYKEFSDATQGAQKIIELCALAERADIGQIDVCVSEVKHASLRVALYRQARRTMMDLMDPAKSGKPMIVAADAAHGYSSILRSSGGPDASGLLGDEGPAYEDRARLSHVHGYANLFMVPCRMLPTLAWHSGGGHRRKGLTLIAARPKSGKTSLVLGMCLDAAMNGIPTKLFDTEMSREEIYNRALAILSGIDEEVIMKGEAMFHPDLSPRLATARRALETIPFHYESAKRKSMESVIARIGHFRNHDVGTMQLKVPGSNKTMHFSKPALVVYDWVKVSDSSSLNNARKEYQVLGDYASMLKDAASEYDLPIVACCQQNRELVGSDPVTWENEQERAIGGSDRLSFFCTMICALRRVYPEEREIIKANLGLRPNRHGDAALAYNSVLGITYNRFGADNRAGIPLYHDLGTYRFLDMGPQAGPIHAKAGGHEIWTMTQEFTRKWSEHKAAGQVNKKGRAKMPSLMSPAAEPEVPA